MSYVFDNSPLSVLFKNYYRNTFRSLWGRFDELVAQLSSAQRDFHQIGDSPRIYRLPRLLDLRSRRSVHTDHRLERRADRRALSCFRLVGGRARRPARACGDLDYDIRARGRHRTSDLVGTRPDRWFENAH